MDSAPGLVTGVTETSQTFASRGYAWDPGAGADLPSYRRPELLAALDDLDMMQDLLQGTRRMHDRSHIYIRKWSSERQETYDIRRKIEKLFEGLARTLSASVGMLYAKNPSINWNQSEAAMSPDWDNID